jgi:hypothetical protein
MVRANERTFWDTGESLLIKSKKVCAAFGDAFEVDYSGSPQLIPAQNISLAPSCITRVVTPCTPPPMAPKVAELILRSSVEGSGLK